MKKWKKKNFFRGNNIQLQKIVSNTDTTKTSWSIERTNQTITTTSGRIFGSSNSYTY